MSLILQDSDEIIALLSDIARAQTLAVYSSLSEGDTVSLSFLYTDRYWCIDNPFVCDELGFTGLPFREIYDHLAYDRTRRDALFETVIPDNTTVDPDNPAVISLGHRRYLPFSTVAVHERVGVCLERSLLLQLAAQQHTSSFLVSGQFERGELSGLHSYNIFCWDGALMLGDVSPVRDKHGSYVMPFISPVIGLDTKTGLLHTPPEQSDGRVYSIEWGSVKDLFGF